MPLRLALVAVGFVAAAATAFGTWALFHDSAQPPVPPIASAPTPSSAAVPVVGATSPNPSRVEAVEPRWHLGTAGTLGTLATRWRSLDPALPREAIRFHPVGPELSIATLPASESEATARATAEPFGGGVTQVRTPSEGLLAAVLLRTTASLHVRSSPLPQSTEVTALQPNSIVVGLTGDVRGSPSRLDDRSTWTLVVVNGSTVGWSSAAYLDTHSRCLPDTRSFAERLPEPQRVALTDEVAIRALPSLRVGERRHYAYVLLARDAASNRSYLGVYGSSRDCEFAQLGSQTFERSIENTYFVDAQPGAGQVLLIVEGPNVDYGLEGAELWQAFLLGNTAELWNVVLRSSESVSWNERERVFFARDTRNGLRGYWPSRVQAQEGDEYLRWDGEALIRDP